ncbi:MAG: hypothetical protein K0U39_04950 [Alphaproteobacteria bacterium]|nr:hypothetical protein [Alphaproteobacteria bacterium]
MTRLILLSLLLSLSIFAKTANAQEPDIAAWRTGYGAEIIGGTHGYGVAFSLRKNYYYSLRFLLLTYENQVKMEENNNNNSYEYAYKSDFQNYALLANIYPVGDRIFISSGVYSLDMRYDRDGYARRSFTEANDENYLLEADYKTAVRYKGNAPYLGIGMGTKRHSKSRITLRAEIGVIFMPSPDDVQVSFGTIQAVGEASLESDASLAAQSELRDKASGAYLAKVKRDADAFKYYPVLEAGITYNF